MWIAAWCATEVVLSVRRCTSSQKFARYDSNCKNYWDLILALLALLWVTMTKIRKSHRESITELIQAT